MGVCGIAGLLMGQPNPARADPFAHSRARMSLTREPVGRPRGPAHRPAEDTVSRFDTTVEGLGGRALKVVRATACPVLIVWILEARVLRKGAFAVDLPTGSVRVAVYALTLFPSAHHRLLYAVAPVLDLARGQLHRTVGATASRKCVRKRQTRTGGACSRLVGAVPAPGHRGGRRRCARHVPFWLARLRSLPIAPQWVTMTRSRTGRQAWEASRSMSFSSLWETCWLFREVFAQDWAHVLKSAACFQEFMRRPQSAQGNRFTTRRGLRGASMMMPPLTMA